jgi:hypothetical protein
MASKSTKNGVYEMLVAQKDAITRITGIITPESIDGLENKLGGAFNIVGCLMGKVSENPHKKKKSGSGPKQ